MSGSFFDFEERDFDAVPASALPSRDFVAAMLRHHRAPETLVDDYVLVASELAADIIEHGDGRRFIVSVDVTDAAWWELSVGGGSMSMLARAPTPRASRLGEVSMISGCGLAVVHHLMDDVVTELCGDRVITRCRSSRLLIG
jgi:anti-sigma regulatory factor (Ser/Thr protein kinase)